MRVSRAATTLAGTLATYIVCDVLLTPIAGIETRPVAKVTGVGFAVLGLLFAGLALAIVALVLLFRRSPRSPILAIVASVLYLPAFATEQAGHFSAVTAPLGIQRVEFVQAIVAVIAVGLSLWVLRSGITVSTNR
jgi:hypothetical protein